MDKTEALEGFEQLVKDLRDEYIEHKGCLTAEFSTSSDNLVEKLDILLKNNVNGDGFGGHWVVFPCDTCKGYNEETPLHVILIDTKSTKDYQNGAELFRANEKITELNKQINHKDMQLQRGIIVDPNDLARVVQIALDSQSELRLQDKDSTTLFMSNLVDDYFGTEDELNPLVSDEDILTKHKELSRLDSIIELRKQELAMIEGAFSSLIPIDPAALTKLVNITGCELHNLIPKNIQSIKHINALLAKQG